MKITIEFDTDSENFNPQEFEEIKNASKLSNALSEIKLIIKDLNHHQYDLNDWKKDNPEKDEIDFITEQFDKILIDNNINNIIL